jgi:hypothetical protein
MSQVLEWKQCELCYRVRMELANLRFVFSRFCWQNFLLFTAEWVPSCSTDEESYCYFLKEFFRQNADVIADDPGLRHIFKGQLFSNEEFQAKQYGKLSRHSLQIRRCGFLVDDIQVLTKAALSCKPFFDKDFTTWTGPAGRFCSIVCGGRSFGHQG